MPESGFMQWCYFLRDGCIAGVAMLPSGLPDEDKIAKAHIVFSKRKGPFDGFEIWDGASVVFTCAAKPEALRAAELRRCSSRQGRASG
jgi:hypothetical protein